MSEEWMVRNTLLVRRGDMVHTNDCARADRGVRTVVPWVWAEGRTRQEVASSAGNGLKFCKVCDPLSRVPEEAES